MVVAEVIINRPTKQLHKPYSYEVPSDLGTIPIGTRVVVPLGSAREEGILIGYRELLEKPTFSIKPIVAVLDSEPWFTDEMLGTAKKLSEYYLCSYGDALRLFTITKKQLKSYERPKEKWIHILPGFSHEQFEIRKKKQRALATYLEEVEVAPLSLVKAKGFTLAVIKQVMNHPLVVVEERLSKTTTQFQYVDHRHIHIPLTEEQKQCFIPIEHAINHDIYEPFLLHGVTGSGKTQVYLRAAASCLEEGKSVIILVPEIILTDQIVTRFVDTFGDEVVVFHSKLTIQERYNNWERLRRKDSHIIIGARSAVFAPSDDIGLIIVDEEHDNSYKQEDMVRYHARKVALWRAQAHQCPVILGSATPSVVSYYKALQSEYHLLELPHRIFDQPMPHIELVDMKEELLYGNYSVFSDALSSLIQETLEKREQMIILLNRRGYSTFVMCRECGKPILCPHCDVALVYHQSAKELKCHYCEYHEPIPMVCPHCQSKKIKYFGSGTQRVEEELKKRYPYAKVARLDQDIATKKGQGDAILHDFAIGAYDILLGTQMVSKGHDFPNVTAVGVLTADSVLNIPLYTAAERTFDLLTQTVGRAGRRNKSGKAVIQTYNPLHYAIIKSKTHDYVGFYNEEIKNRRDLGYPPYGEMIHIVVRHKHKEVADKIATSIVDDISAQADISVSIFGPYEEGISKIRDLYRLSIMLRGSHLNHIKKYIYNSWIFTQEGVLIDVDPV